MKSANKFFCLLAILWLIGNVAFAPSAFSEIRITTDTTWTHDASPYNFNEDVVVEAAVTLSIEPGSDIRFAEGTGLIVEGTLRAVGTNEQKIVFRPIAMDDAVKHLWSGILLKGNWDVESKQLDTSVLEYVDISFATAGISGDDTAATINHCWIYHNNDGLTFLGIAAPSITNSFIGKNFRHGIFYFGSSLFFDSENKKTINMIIYTTFMMLVIFM